jgi:gliding motility-associated-like protein
VRYLLITLFSLLPLISLAQLTAPGMKTVRYTAYPSAPGVKDPIFIFCNSTGTQTGTLQASGPGGTAYSFSWYQWSDITKSFSIFLKTDVAVTSSIFSGLNEGGYKVRITNAGGYDNSLVGWIFLDKPLAIAKLQNFTCDYVALSGKAAIDTFYYKDPANSLAVKLRNAIAFNWSSDPVSTIPYPTLEINPVTFTPPLENVTYKLQVVDSFLCTAESSFPYTSIHVKANFSVSPDKGEAPLVVKFDPSKSVRGSFYHWKFGDDSTATLQNKDTVSHTYYRPGEYIVKLAIESDLHCIDSMKFEKIVVDPSKIIMISNVLTPNDDGLNDYFWVESKSLRTMSVEIFSRSGLMVYNFSGEGNKLTSWKGWDGNINNSSTKASPGIYFYIIRARGWDDKIYDNKEYRGFLYLYR